MRGGIEDAAFHVGWALIGYHFAGVVGAGASLVFSSLIMAAAIADDD